MSYNSILKNLVTKSNLTYAQIIDECKKHKTSIDKSYLSRLINSNLTPSDEVSNALEKVFGTKANLLVVEAFFDKSPQPVKDFIANLKDIIFLPTLSMFDVPDEKVKEDLKENLYSQPLLDILDAFGELKNSNELSKDFNSENNKGISVNIDDSGFEPIIPNGSSIKIETCKSYINGDIVAVKTDENGSVIARKYYKISETEIMLIPANFNEEPIVVKKGYVAILGKIISYKANVN